MSKTVVMELRTLQRVTMTLREIAAFALLGALLVCVLGAAYVGAATVGGLGGMGSGGLAGLLTAEALRRPVGRAVSVLVDD